MANTNSAAGGGFLGNLGKIYLGYTGGFIVFTLILAVLEQMGVPNKIIGYCFVILTIGVYAYIGILSRTMDLSEYYVAGRKVPALYNGMATGADWMSAASFIYIVAQCFGIGIITSRFLGIPFEVAIFVGLLGILVCSMLGGMRAVTWTQVAQYIILIISYLVPVIWLSTELYGIPIPELTYGRALEQITQLEDKLGIVKHHVDAFTDATGKFSWTEFNNFWALVLCLMIGTASLPHILMRYFTTPSVREARNSVAWSIFFIFLLYFTAPAYAAFAKLEVYQNVIGQPIANLPAWVQNWSQVGGLLTIKDANNDGILQLPEFIINQDIIVLSMPEIAGLPYVVSGLVAAGGLAAALSTADGLLLAIANALSHDVYYKMIDPNAPTHRRLVVSRVLLVLVAILAAWTASHRPADIVAMVAWAFSLAAGGLFPALVLGIWWKRTTSAGAVAGMFAGFGITLLYLVVSRYYPSFGVTALGMTSLLNPATGAPLVPDLAAALANPNADTVAGLASQGGWFDVNNISAALFGLPVGFAVMIIVSLLTPAPSVEMQNFIDEIRRPRGRALNEEKA